MPPGPPQRDSASAKRKRPQQQSVQPRKRSRPSIHDARAIASQTSGKAYGEGEVHVDKFVKAHEFEIRALEDGMRRSKKSLTTRAFQSVPRDLRRRTASHNIKRVPERLRARAHKEMVEDNTPTVITKKRKQTPHMRLRLELAKRSRKENTAQDASKGIGGPAPSSETSTKRTIKRVPLAQSKTGIIKPREPRIKRNTLQKPPKPKARFRKRQIHKTWLPTHLFHAKRAHMTPPKEPLWRMAIPLSPTAKSYRPMHRASSLRGAIAWDMSYMSTIGLEGAEKSVVNLLKAIGVGKDDGVGFWERRASRWTNGTRSWDGWLYERDGWPKRSIGPATVIWCAKESSDLVDESATGVASSRSSKEKRKVFIRIHPSAFIHLWEEVLRLSKVQKPGVTVEDLRFEIGSIEVTGPASTEALVGILRPARVANTADGIEYRADDVWNMLFDVSNPGNLPANALLAMNVSDPRLHLPRRPHDPQPTRADPNLLLYTLASWPIDRYQPVADIFDRTARLTACRQMPSQKAINRRKAFSEPGRNPEPAQNDPQIPALLLASRNPAGGQGSWTLLLPWKCVLPVWYALVYFPLSTGGTVRFGGLNQKRQLAFEMGIPWFPADCPGTKAGMDWETRECEKRKAEWESRPKGKRVEYDSLQLGEDRKGEVGLGWSCDWETLARKTRAASDETTELYRIPSAIVQRQLRSPSANGDEVASTHHGGIFTVKLSLLSRGVPIVCARIYRLPTTNAELHKQWTSLFDARSDSSPSATPYYFVAKDAPSHVQQRRLAESLLSVPSAPTEYPQTPGEQDLIGFITTGNFNLGEGKGTGLGCILLDKVLEYRRLRDAAGFKECEVNLRLCILREAGQAMGRLARWEAV